MKLSKLIKPFNTKTEEVVYHKFVSPTGNVYYIPVRIKKETKK